QIGRLDLGANVGYTIVNAEFYDCDFDTVQIAYTATGYSGSVSYPSPSQQVLLFVGCRFHRGGVTFTGDSRHATGQFVSNLFKRCYFKRGNGITISPDLATRGVRVEDCIFDEVRGPVRANTPAHIANSFAHKSSDISTRMDDANFPILTSLDQIDLPAGIYLDKTRRFRESTAAKLPVPKLASHSWFIEATAGDPIIVELLAKKNYLGGSVVFTFADQEIALRDVLGYQVVHFEYTPSHSALYELRVRAEAPDADGPYAVWIDNLMVI